MCTLALLFAAYCAVWALGVKKNLRFDKETPAMTSLVVYGGALIFGVYFAVSAAYLWVYRYFFRNYTQATKGEGDRWGKHFWNHDYERT